jgi:hypothetical protein
MLEISTFKSVDLHLRMLLFDISRIVSFAFFSKITRTMVNVENHLLFLWTEVVFPINALNLLSKSYSGLELPKSKTVKQSFPSAKRNYCEENCQTFCWS